MPTPISGLPITTLYKQLSSGEDGITHELAAQRLAEQQKATKVQSRFQRDLKLLISQFTNPLVLLLVVAVLLSAFLGQRSDTLIILFILLASGLLSFWQEWNAGRAVEELQQIIQLKCNVIREGKEIEITTKEVVPGDILVLNAGDIIPADCRLVIANELHVNESSITGESYPQEKMPGEIPEEKTIAEKKNCLWQGTNVVSGTASALVVNVGKDTVFGQMEHSLLKNDEAAFQKGIKRFGYFLMQITIVLSIVILSINLYFHKPLFESILFALAIAVGMAPELLPAIMTFGMSAGAKRMLKKKVIVKKLSSIFNFGEVDVLCTDKTGTITEGEIQVSDITDSNGASSVKARQFAYLNSHFQNGFTNPIDDALQQLGLSATGYTKQDEIPYDFIRKRLSIAVSYGDKKYLITKGAIDNILDVCTRYEDHDGTTTAIKDNITAIHKRYTDYCDNGFRTMGIAYKEITTTPVTRADEKDMTFLGFILLEDPLKEGIVDVLDRLRKLHVSVKIITGDNRYVSNYTAKKLGLKKPVIVTGDQIRKMLPEALTVRAKRTDVFAEVEPNQKEQIIRALQHSGHTIAYMGDGINDVAAIHTADTGISTNNAVDVAKQAADFVLVEKDLSVLADGIYEGRKTFANSWKYIFISTGATFGNMFSVAGASLFLPFLPMLPKQILLTNFLTDFPFLFIASDNVDSDQLEKPGKWDIKLIRNFMIVFGLHSSIFDFITFYVLYHYFHLRDAPFRTGWFIESVLTELLILFIIRTRRSFFKSMPGKGLLITAAITFAITILLPVSPLAAEFGLSIAHIQQAIALTIIILSYVITADLLKIFFF